MKHCVYLFASLLLYNAVWASDEASAGALEDAARMFTVAMNAGEYQAIANLTHPRVVENVGGKHKLIQAMKGMLSSIPRVTDMRFNEAAPIVKMPRGIASIVPYETTLYLNDGEYALRSFYIAWSPDGGSKVVCG